MGRWVSCWAKAAHYIIRRHISQFNMFGYTESPYEVLGTYSHQHESRLEVGELRKVQHSASDFERMATHRKLFNIEHAELDTYIAITARDRAGREVLDVILRYDDEKTLREDWARVVSEPEVALSALKPFERIEGHGTGFRRDGAVVMY